MSDKTDAALIDIMLEQIRELNDSIDELVGKREITKMERMKAKRTELIRKVNKLLPHDKRVPEYSKITIKQHN